MLISVRGDITTILLDNGADIEARSRKGQPKNLCLNFEESIVERNYYTYMQILVISFSFSLLNKVFRLLIGIQIKHLYFRSDSASYCMFCWTYWSDRIVTDTWRIIQDKTGPKLENRMTCGASKKFTIHQIKLFKGPVNCFSEDVKKSL